ncbi:ribonuclease HII [Magnetococcales bacterium HHB-1]
MVAKTQDLAGWEREKALWCSGYASVCGVDEVGRGPLAGPVVAAAVILPPHALQHNPGFKDSKKLSLKQKANIYGWLYRHASSYAVSYASVAEIDQMNIRRASLLAMQRAVMRLKQRPDYILVDGRDLPYPLPAPGEPMIQGDRKSASIAAASVLAKVVRDRWMAKLSLRFPGFGWERNRGYGTVEHKRQLMRLGPSLQHRRTFAPVRHILAQHQENPQKKLAVL